MGLFDKIKGPIFLKDDSEAEKQLTVLKELRTSLSGSDLEKIDREISNVESGIIGEKQVRFELENSHIPMFVLHDLFFEHNGLKAQIDYLVITHKNFYVIECKNLFGNIEINNSGSFIRTVQFKGQYYKEGIYSPITQNERHMEIIKAIREEKHNILMKVLFEKNFYQNYHSIVVLANPKTVLNDKFAKKEIKDKVIRADQLIAYIKQKDSEKDYTLLNEKEMEEYAKFFRSINKTNPVDYTEKYRSLLDEHNMSNISENDNTHKICPVCGAPMVLRTASKGANIGKKFYGCSTFPRCKGIINL